MRRICRPARQQRVRPRRRQRIGEEQPTQRSRRRHQAPCEIGAAHDPSEPSRESSLARPQMMQNQQLNLTNRRSTERASPSTAPEPAPPPAPSAQRSESPPQSPPSESPACQCHAAASPTEAAASNRRAIREQTSVLQQRRHLYARSREARRPLGASDPVSRAIQRTASI